MVLVQNIEIIETVQHLKWFGIKNQRKPKENIYFLWKIKEHLRKTYTVMEHHSKPKEHIYFSLEIKEHHRKTYTFH